MTTPLTVFERWTDADGVPLFADRKWPQGMKCEGAEDPWQDYGWNPLEDHHAEDSCIAAAVGELLGQRHWFARQRDDVFVCGPRGIIGIHEDHPTALARLNGRTPREVAP